MFGAAAPTAYQVFLLAFLPSLLISGYHPKLPEMPFGISGNFNRVSKGLYNPLAGCGDGVPAKLSA